jgi:glyoxylase-like metal-dependent hydrolase (beta-lactamase superfamily II)
VRVHVIEVGSITFPRGWWEAHTRAAVARSVLRGVGGPEDEIPILSYVVEHDEGHIVVDTGFHHATAERVSRNPLFRRIARVKVDAGDVVAAQMRSRGLRPEDVRLVLPTHLDMDHAGGVGYFPNAEVRVHRSEWEYRKTLGGRLRFQPRSWPDGFSPTLYDLAPNAYGAFERSLAVADRRDVTIVPTPGHSRGHVGIVVKANGRSLFFGGDHLIRQSWFARDMAAGIEPPNLYPRLARDTNARIRRFVADTPTILLPSHDAEAAAHLAALEPLKI